MLTGFTKGAHRCPSFEQRTLLQGHMRLHPGVAGALVEDDDKLMWCCSRQPQTCHHAYPTDKVAYALHPSELIGTI
jgi:hypothetical protein